MRGGWTLHEMLISLAVTGMIASLAVHAALSELRFFRGAGEAVVVEQQLADVAGVMRGLVWSVSPGEGDIVAALDTALEIRVGIGTAVVCESSTGRVVIPAPSPSANTLASFDDAPQPDDFVMALPEDSSASAWTTLTVASAPVYGGACTRYPAAPAAWALALREQVVVPEGTILRLLRPLRVNVYRASDARWYLGARDWSAVNQRFNTIQPLAGPLDAPSADPDRTGFRIDYLDADGATLAEGSDTRRIRGIRVIARAASTRPARIAGLMTIAGERYADSSVAVITLRNGR